MNLVFAVKSMSAAYGGAERILAAVANGLAERGHQIQVVTFDSPEARPVYPLDERIVYLPLGVGRPDRPARLFETVARIVRLRGLMRRQRPDVVIGFMHSTFVPLALAAAGTGVRTIASEHIVPEHYRGKPLQYMLLLLATRLVDRVTVVSEQARQLFPAFAQKRMVVVPNPVLTNPCRAVPATERNRHVILNVGRLTHQKDQPTLVRAFASIATERPDWTLRLVGDGPLRSELEELVGELDLGERVELAPPTNEVETEYANADVLAVPSRYESFGMVTAEALAAGLPVVGFAECSGTNELVVDGRNGVLAAGTPDRASGFRCALEQITGDDEYRARLAAGAAESVAGLAPDGVIREWERLCQSVVVVGA